MVLRERIVEVGRTDYKPINDPTIMTKQILSIEQMRHLQELGLDTSNASWYRPDADTEYFEVLNNAMPTGGLVGNEDYIPAYTLQDILNILPSEIKSTSGNRLWLCIDMAEQWIYYYCEYAERKTPVRIFDFRDDKPLIDAAYTVLIWCIRKGYVKTGKEARP